MKLNSNKVLALMDSKFWDVPQLATASQLSTSILYKSLSKGEATRRTINRVSQALNVPAEEITIKEELNTEPPKEPLHC